LAISEESEDLAVKYCTGGVKGCLNTYFDDPAVDEELDVDGYTTSGEVSEISEEEKEETGEENEESSNDSGDSSSSNNNGSPVLALSLSLLLVLLSVLAMI